MPSWRARIRREVEEQMARELGDYALIVIARVRTPANQGMVGRNIVEIAKGWGIQPVDAVLRLIEEEAGSVEHHRPRHERGERRTRPAVTPS